MAVIAIWPVSKAMPAGNISAKKGGNPEDRLVS